MADDEGAPSTGLDGLFSQLQAAQADLEARAAALDSAVVEGSAAGGAVVVRVSGALAAESVHIDPAIIDPADPALLEDALLAALRDALGRITQMRSTVDAQVASPFGPDMDLGSLVGSLDLGGILGGVDVNALMGNLGMGLDLGAFGSQAEPDDDDYYDGTRRGRGRATKKRKAAAATSSTAREPDRPVAVFAGPIQELVDELGRLPGVGPRSAQRIAFYLLETDRDSALRLANAIAEVKDRIRLCERCFNVAEAELCTICSDSRRDSTVICVVEDPRDIVAVERTREFHGTYHVLGGALSPIDGVGPEQLRVRPLLVRLGLEGVAEVILCTNPNLEGEATAMYLARLLLPLGVKVTRIASGLPVGGDLEYADELTLGRALEGRREVSG